MYDPVMKVNAQLTEKIFDGGFCAFLCTKGDSENFSGGAVGYVTAHYQNVRKLLRLSYFVFR